MENNARHCLSNCEGLSAPFFNDDAPAGIRGGRSLSMTVDEWLSAPRLVAPSAPTQKGADGIYYDFNGGVRILLPNGKWRVRVEDVVSGFVHLACEVGGGRISIACARHIPFRLRIWEAGKRRPLLDHTMHLKGRWVALALPVRTLADFVRWFPLVERFREEHGCRLECLMERNIADLVRHHYPDVLFRAWPKPSKKDLYASFGPELFVGDGLDAAPIRDGGAGEEDAPALADGTLHSPASPRSAGTLERSLPAAFIRAAAACYAGDYRTFDRWMARLSQHAAAMPEGDPETNLWRGELEFLHSLAARGDLEAAAAHQRRAIALLNDGPSALAAPESPWTAGSPSVLFLFHREAGGLEREVRLMHESLPHYCRLSSGHGAGGEHAMEAEALYHRGDFAGAATAERRAEAAAKSEGQADNVLAARYLRMRLALLAGDYPLARQVLAGMRECVHKPDDRRRLAAVDMCQTRLSTALGRTDGVAEWLRRGVGGEERLHPLAGGYCYLVHGGVLLAEERWAEAAGMFSWLLKARTYADNLMLAVYARIYLAAANYAMGAKAEAKEELRRAGDLAFPDGIVMPFVENWPCIGGFAGKAIADAPSALFVNASLWEKRRNGIITRYFSPNGPPLSERELELARLAISGKKYREIAHEVHLAYGTVKRAFVTIYSKLGISSLDELRGYLKFKGME